MAANPSPKEKPQGQHAFSVSGTVTPEHAIYGVSGTVAFSVSGSVAFSALGIVAPEHAIYPAD